MTEGGLVAIDDGGIEPRGWTAPPDVDGRVVTCAAVNGGTGIVVDDDIGVFAIGRGAGDT